jgi:tripartite-type tricarboxylate transporter receptor subunit TctC
MHHDQDIRNMGGLRKYMPVTWITSLVGSLALIGTPFFSGFYSKDSIIEAAAFAKVPGAGFAYFAVLAGVFVTAFYSFRMYFLVFHGKERFGQPHGAHAHAANDHAHDHESDDESAHDDHGHHGLAPGEKPHETPLVVTGPLVLLAIPSVLIGLWAIGPMLFGDYFKGVIFVSEKHTAMEQLAHHFHGWAAMGAHAFATLPFWLAAAGVASSYYCYMINPALQPKLPYDTLRDLAGVSQLALGHFGLFAHPSFAPSTLPELVAYVKKHPGQVSYATPGVGTGTHLAGEMLNHMAGLDMVHVPYKGSAPAQQDVIGGRVPLLFDVLFSSMPFVKDGRMKVLALSSPRRAQSSPEIPLVAESVPGFSAMSIIGVIAPAGVPADLRRRIGADIARGVKSPELNERMVALGMEPVGSTADEYDALIRSEIDKWSAVVKRAGIRLE